MSVRLGKESLATSSIPCATSICEIKPIGLGRNVRIRLHLPDLHLFRPVTNAELWAITTRLSDITYAFAVPMSSRY